MSVTLDRLNQRDVTAIAGVDGGHVEAESELGKGTTIRVVLPVRM